MAKSRLRVLVTAYACNPKLGSEEGIGWGWVMALAKHHDLHVLTSENHREDIEAEIKRGATSAGPVFYYVPKRWYHYSPRRPSWRWLQSMTLRPIYNTLYRWWLKDAAVLAKSIAQKQHFDLTHQITYEGFRFPGHVWEMPIPFVWGPIGGLEQTNWRLLPALGWYGALYFACRNIINTFDKHCRPLVRRAMKKAHGGIIAATPGIRDEIKRVYGEESEVICEIGLPPLGLPDRSKLRARAADEPLRLIWIGLLEPRKALPFLFRALPHMPAEARWRLDVFGEGPMDKKWRREAERAGLASRVTWHGRVARDEVLKALRGAHVLVVTSAYDLTSTVVVEALANGVPVLCPDHCGFHDAVTDGCGIRIPADAAGQFVTGLCNGLKQLHDNEEQRMRLACGALERARAFEWEAKAQKVNEIYMRKAAAG